MNNIIKGLSAAALISVAGLSWAGSISLYQKPDTKSTIAAKVETGQRLIPIFQTQAHQGWIKVADPSNGQVGWMKLKAPKPGAAQATQPITKVVTKKTDNGYVERIVTTTDANGPKTYRVVEYTGPKKLNDKQVQKVIQRMEQRNAQMQRDMNRMMADMQANFFNFQPIMPPTVERVIVVPVQADAKDASPQPQANANAATTEQPKKPSFWQKIKDKVSK